MVDTHAHLGVCEPADGELVADARRAGVRRILTVGLDEGSNREAIGTTEAQEGVFASVGRHPNSASGFDDAAAADIEELAGHERVRAIGETGLDYYRDSSPRDAQRAAFAAQIGIARRTGLPLVIHLRDQPRTSDAMDEAFGTLAAEAGGVTVILHCCSVPPGRVGEAVEHGWYCSFAGNVTYPKSDELRETARLVPEELLLVETDSPFLAPQSVRGKPNQPANVVEVAEVVAAERGVPYGELERSVEANAARVFGW
ncbi:MAG: TatD family deoxyribonuclease [Actinobacteria bacterium]|nr:MAG: TatD family deoxyribonuclease [Actinomycetota bacterium]